MPLAPTAGELTAAAAAFVDGLRAAGAGAFCLPPSAGGVLLAAAPVLTLRESTAADVGTLPPAEVLRGSAPFDGALARGSAAVFAAGDVAAALLAPSAAVAAVPGGEICNMPAASLFVNEWP